MSSRRVMGEAGVVVLLPLVGHVPDPHGANADPMWSVVLTVLAVAPAVALVAGLMPDAPSP